VWASTIHTFKRGVVAGSASYTASGREASVSSSRVRECAPSAGGRASALVVGVTKGVAIGTLRLGVEPQASLGPVCRGEGRQAPANEVRGSWACHSNNHC